MKKIFLAFILSTMFSPLVYADACDQVQGNWSGSWHAFGYNCRVYGDGITAGEDIYFNFRLSHCYGVKQNFAMSGHCRNGQVLLANDNAIMTGMISENHLMIQGNNQQANLFKS